MSQSLANNGKRIIVLGGGLAGLSYAHYLRNFLAYHGKSGLIKKITILEANDYMGGCMKSNVFDDGLVHEMGPRSIRSNYLPQAKNTAALVEQLGLLDRVLTNTAQKRGSFVYRDGKLWEAPFIGIKGAFSKLPATKTKLWSCVWKDYSNSQRMDLSPYPHNDPPLYDFIKYRFGEDAAESIADPITRGVTAGDCRQLSTKSIMRDQLRGEQLRGGVLRGITMGDKLEEYDDLFINDLSGSTFLEIVKKKKVLSYSLDTGLQTLPEHLSNSLLNTNDDGVIAIYNRTKATSIRFDDIKDGNKIPCTIKVETVDGEKVDMECDHVIAALPAPNLTRLLEDHDSSFADADQELALDFIRNIQHVPVGCVTLEYRGLEKVMPVMDGFGFLAHSKSDSDLLGVSFDSTIWPSIDRDTGAFRMTCMMGGAWAEQKFGTSNMDQVPNAKLEQLALAGVNKILGIKQDPFRMSTLLWKVGIAQHRPGHYTYLEKTREMIDKTKLPLTLLGQSYDGISINDVIFYARRAADKFVKSL